MSESEQQKSEEELTVEEAFNIFDKDGNGYICVGELGMVMRGMGCNPLDEEIVAFAKQLDSDGSGRIDFKEFRTFILDYKAKHNNSRKEIENAFRVFDKDGNGYIDASELKQMLHRFGQNISDADIEEMIAVADVDADGRINYKEFANFICESVKK